jgi:hypothetical protein
MRGVNIRSQGPSQWKRTTARRDKAPPIATWCLCALLLVPALLAGCVHRKPYHVSLKESLRAASTTIHKKDPAGFLGHLTEKQKIGVKEDDIKSGMDSNPSEFAHLASMIDSPQEIRMEVTVALADDQKVVFVFDFDQKGKGSPWSIDRGFLDSAKAATPADAVAVLMKKLVALREVMQQEGVLAESYKTLQIEGLDALIEELSVLNPRDIVSMDDHAYIVLPTGRRIEFVFEEGEWKVSRIIPSPLK